MAAEKKNGGKAGVVLVTHGVFGQSLLEAAGQILGPQEKCSAVSILLDMGADGIVDLIRKAIESTGSGAGVLVLTDLFGGTPTTLSLSLLKSAGLEVITGVNLPMLIKVLQSRDLPLAEIAAQAKKAGQQGIVVAGDILRRKRSEG